MTFWNKIKLGEIATITSSKRIFANEYQTEGIPFYRGKEIIEKHNGNNVSTELYISRQKYEEIKSKFDVPKTGDILLSSVGTLGVPWLVDEEEFYFKDGNLTWLRCNEKVTCEFLYLWLNSPEAKNQINAMCIGSTQKALTIETLKKFVVTLPTLKIQKNIVNVINPIEKKIRVNAEINRNLSEQARSVYMETFGKFEKTKVLEDYPVKIYSGGTPSTSKKEYWEGGDIHWLSSGETANEFVTTTDKTITQLGVDNSSTKWASKYDVVTASAGQGHTRGQTTMILLNTCINQSVIVTHAAKEYMPFIFFNLSGRYEELRVLSDGTSTRGSLTTKIMAKLKMPDVTENTIIKFSDYAWSAISQIEVNLKENEKLACLRDSLLLKLMTGEIDVSDLNI